MSFLVDTDTCSAYIKGVGRVMHRFVQYASGLYISTVTLGELYAWVLRAKASSKRMHDLLDLLREVRLLSVCPLSAL